MTRIKWIVKSINLTKIIWRRWLARNKNKKNIYDNYYRKLFWLLDHRTCVQNVLRKSSSLLTCLTPANSMAEDLILSRSLFMTMFAWLLESPSETEENPPSFSYWDRRWYWVEEEEETDCFFISCHTYDHQTWASFILSSAAAWLARSRYWKTDCNWIQRNSKYCKAAKIRQKLECTLINTMQHNTWQHNSIQFNTIQHNTIQNSAFTQ